MLEGAVPGLRTSGAHVRCGRGSTRASVWSPACVASTACHARRRESGKVCRKSLIRLHHRCCAAWERYRRDEVRSRHESGSHVGRLRGEGLSLGPRWGLWLVGRDNWWGRVEWGRAAAAAGRWEWGDNRCAACQDYMYSISRNVNFEALKRAGVDMVIIGNGSPAMIKSYRSELLPRFPTSRR